MKNWWQDIRTRMTRLWLQCITLEGWTDMLYWVHDAQGNLGMASELISLPLFIFLIKLVVNNMSITNHPCALCRCLLHLNGHPRLLLRDEPHSWCALWRVLKGHLCSYHLFFSTIYLDKRQTCEVWKWLSLAIVYEIMNVNNNCQSKRRIISYIFTNYFKIAPLIISPTTNLCRSERNRNREEIFRRCAPSSRWTRTCKAIRFSILTTIIIIIITIIIITRLSGFIIIISSLTIIHFSIFKYIFFKDLQGYQVFSSKSSNNHHRYQIPCLNSSPPQEWISHGEDLEQPVGDTNALKVEMGKTKVALFNCFVEMGKTKVALFNFLLLCNKNILDDWVYLCYFKDKMWQDQGGRL